MDEKIIEHVARAIRLAVLTRARAIRVAKEWEQLPEALREQYRLEAGAAITAYEAARGALIGQGPGGS